MQKKKASIIISATALSTSEFDPVWEFATLCNSLYMHTGKAFCCTLPGSAFLIPLNCLDNAGWMCSDPGTYVGLYPTFVLKISPSFARVSCTVDEANSVSLGFENCLLRNAAAKAPNSAVRLSGEKLCNQMSWLRLIHFVYSIHLLHVLDSLPLVFFVTPFSLCTSAARRSATRVFLAGDGRF